MVDYTDKLENSFKEYFYLQKTTRNCNEKTNLLVYDKSGVLSLK